jgi:hypothetical protein
MSRIATMLLFLACAAAGDAAEPAAGRWQGVIDIPGRPIPITLDLDKQAGVWRGSVTMTGLSIRAPLESIAMSNDELRFDIAGVLATSEHGAPRFSGHIRRQGDSVEMQGEFMQAGNRAPFVLRRTGVAQVDAPRRSTKVAASIEGTWVGEYELGGYSRRVTIKIANTADAANAEFVVVGKRTTNLPIDLVTQQGRYVRIESNATAIHFEGRIGPDAREIVGTFEQGPFEAALTLRRPQ